MPLDNSNVGLNNPAQNLGTQYDNAQDPSQIGTGNDSASTFGSILSGAGNFLSSPLGNLALYGGAAAGLSSEATAAAGENNTLAGQIGQIGAPSVAASNTLLKAYQGGTLTTPFQTQLNAALTFNQQQATSEQQSVAQMLDNSGGGANIQSAQAGQNQQIQAQQSLLNNQATAQAFTNELSASESLLSAGGPYVQQAVLTEIQNNQLLQQQLQQLFTGLASAYAQGQGGSTQGGPGGGSGLPNQIGKIIQQMNGNGGLGSSIQGTVNSFGVGSTADTTLNSEFGSAASDFNTSALEGSSGIAQNALDIGSSDAFSGGGAASDALSYFPTGSAAAGATGTGATAADLGYTAVQGGDLAAVGTGSDIAMNTGDAAAVSAAGSGGAGAALAGLGIGAGAIGGAYLLGNYLTSLDVPSPQQTAKLLSNEIFNNPNTNAIQRSAMNSSGSKPYTGTTDAEAQAWLLANIGMGGSSLAHTSQQQA